MNKFFITTPEIASALEMATGISAEKANQEGCVGTTSFWWSVVRHPDGEQAALAIHDAPNDGVVYQNGELIITTDDLIDELPADWQTETPDLDAP